MTKTTDTPFAITELMEALLLEVVPVDSGWRLTPTHKTNFVIDRPGCAERVAVTGPFNGSFTIVHHDSSVYAETHHANGTAEAVRLIQQLITK